KAGLLLLSAFAATGVILGMVGIFGVVSNSVIRRRREMAIRVALGATRQRTVILLTRLALLASLGGILLGSGIVISFARVLSSFLFGITALHTPVYLVNAAIIAMLAVMSTFAPATRLFRFNIHEIL